jgi:hypothetical protein
VMDASVVRLVRHPMEGEAAPRERRVAAQEAECQLAVSVAEVRR